MDRNRVFLQSRYVSSGVWIFKLLVGCAVGLFGGFDLFVVLLPEKMKLLAYCGEKEGRTSYWLQPTSYDLLQFKEVWQRIGLGHEIA
jgi:hypothetical protein